MRADQSSISHLLNRAAFGPSAADWSRVERIGTASWLDEQLQPARLDDTATEQLLAQLTTLDLDSATLMRDYPSPQQVQRMLRDDEEPDEEMMRRLGRQSFLPVQELSRARVARAIGSRRQLNEVLVDFWFNHFNVFVGKGPLRHLLTAYERDTIRPHVLGRFRELLGAVARSPAMLVYLDNWRSGAEPGRKVAGGPPRARRGDAVRDAIRRRPSMRTPNRGRLFERPEGLNENYARELLELHTLGVDGGYGQQDVRETARALTGWTLRLTPEGGGGFVFRADWHDAEAKQVLGAALPAGRGAEDGEQVLDILAEHPSTARFVSTKLCRRLVADEPPESLVDKAATRFAATRGDLRATTEIILRSPEFNDPDVRGAKVKSPLEFLASGARALGLEPSVDPRLAQGLAALGEPLYRASAPTGYADKPMARTSANALLARMELGTRLAEASLIRRPPLEGDASARIDRILADLLPGRPTQELRTTLISWADTRDATVTDAQIASLALGSPEFQRR